MLHKKKKQNMKYELPSVLKQDVSLGGSLQVFLLRAEL